MTKHKKHKFIILVVVLMCVSAFFLQSLKRPIMLVKCTNLIIEEAKDYLYENVIKELDVEEKDDIIYNSVDLYHIDDNINCSNMFRFGYIFPYALVEVCLTYESDNYVIVFEKDTDGNMKISNMIKNRGY